MIKLLFIIITIMIISYLILILYLQINWTVEI